MVLPTGDVALYWDFDETYAEIGFSGDGTLYAFASRPGFEPVHLDDVRVPQVSEPWFPPEVLRILDAEDETSEHAPQAA
jgi:hypothetical protein